MKNRRPIDEEPHGRRDKSKSSVGSTHQKKKNMKRLGGGGLSLEAFANMKSNRNQYNPALISAYPIPRFMFPLSGCCCSFVSGVPPIFAFECLL